MSHFLICCFMVAVVSISMLEGHETDQQFSGPTGPTKEQSDVIRDEVEKLGHTGKLFDELTAQDRENIKDRIKIGLDDLLKQHDDEDSKLKRAPPSMMREPGKGPGKSPGGMGKAPGSPSDAARSPGSLSSANPSMQDGAPGGGKHATGPKAPGKKFSSKEPTRPGLKNIQPPSVRRPGPAGPPTVKQRNEL